MTNVIGIVNVLSHDRYVYFGEIDGVDLFTACEEANFISQIGEIDIDLLCSSVSRHGRNYHLVSYDIISKDRLIWIQRYGTDQEHYFNVDEIDLFHIGSRFQCNTLRIGDKDRKGSPKFVKRFLNSSGEFPKSLRHLKEFRFFCHVPNFQKETCFLDIPCFIVVYRTGINAHHHVFKNGNQQRLANLERRISIKHNI